MRFIILVALGAAVAASGRAQAPAAASEQPASVVRVQAQTMTSQAHPGMRMLGDVTFQFSDGTQLSAKEVISADRSFEGAPREFILSGDVRLRLTEKSMFVWRGTAKVQP